jgi:hypothetical protein
MGERRRRNCVAKEEDERRKKQNEKNFHTRGTEKANFHVIGFLFGWGEMKT